MRVSEGVGLKVHVNAALKQKLKAEMSWDQGLGEGGGGFGASVSSAKRLVHWAWSPLPKLDI